MKPAKVMLDGQIVGTIEDIGYDTPYIYGKWVPADDAADQRIKAIAEQENAETPVVTVEGEASETWYVSSLEDGEINLRQRSAK
jgi:hypothetical protein